MSDGQDSDPNDFFGCQQQDRRTAGMGPTSTGPGGGSSAWLAPDSDDSSHGASFQAASFLGPHASRRASASVPEPSIYGRGSSESLAARSSRPADRIPSSASGTSLISWLIDKLAPTVEAQSGGGSGNAYTTAPWVIGSPRNGVIEPTRFGAVLPESFNYELSIPVVASLGNRELNIPLALYYNSQIYSMTGPTTLQYDPNQSWPAPGFSMGFGRIDTTLSGDQQTAYYTLVEASGTRHYLGSGPASVTGGPPPYPTYTTNDGTYISYVGDAVHGGELYYPSGVKYDINLVNNRLLVTQITSCNGNFVPVAYMQNIYDGNGNPIPPVYSPFALSYVVDTLGRQIKLWLRHIQRPGSSDFGDRPGWRRHARLSAEEHHHQFLFEHLRAADRAGLPACGRSRLPELLGADFDQCPAGLSDVVFRLWHGVLVYHGPEQHGDGDI